MTTYLQIINLIKDTALAQPNVHTVVREFTELNREDTKYSAVVIQDRDGLADRILEQDYITYTWHLGYVDRLTYDASNRDDIFSTGMNVITNIMNSIRDTYFPTLEVRIIDRFNTFNQRFTANCAGVYVVLAIDVPVSGCVDGEQFDIYDKYHTKITENGNYHIVPDGKPFGEVDITVAVSGTEKPEEVLTETITSNGSYSFLPDQGNVFSKADITVAVSGAPKPEVSLVESVTSNGDYTYNPAEGVVFNSVAFSVDVHPSNTLSRTYTTNGTKTIEGEFNGGNININVHPSNTLSRTYTTNGTKTIEGEFNGGTISVDVHPTEKLMETITSNGTVSLSGEWKDAEINVSVSEAKTEVSLVESISSNGSYSYTPDPGSVYNSVALSVDVHPTERMRKTYTSNGIYGELGDFNSATITVDVHPSTSISETYTSNGIYTIAGEFNGGQVAVSVPTPVMSTLSETISSNGSYSYTAPSGQAYDSVAVSVDIHPSTSLVSTITSNGIINLSGEWMNAQLTVSVITSTVSMSQSAYDSLSVKDPYTIYLITG